MRVAHLGLTVTDQERSRRFYETHFGFDAGQARSYPDGTLIIQDSDGFALALHPGSAAPGDEFLHFGYVCADPAEVRTVRQRLLASRRGVAGRRRGHRQLRGDQGLGSGRIPGRDLLGALDPTDRQVVEVRGEQDGIAGTNRSAARAKQERRPRHSRICRRSAHGYPSMTRSSCGSACALGAAERDGSFEALFGPSGVFRSYLPGAGEMRARVAGWVTRVAWCSFLMT